MSNIYLLQNYNNYYNRIVKKPYMSLGGYLNNYDYQVFFGLNFNPNDGISTIHIFNADFADTTPNYMLVENEQDNHFTRWFIVESVRLRAGQYKVSLKRDVLSDYYDETISAKTFIHKGFVSAENPLIFNSENIAVNQIKKAEVLIKDRTKCAWIVGYVSPNLAEQEQYDISVEYAQENVSDISEFEYIDYVGQNLQGLLSTEESFYNFYVKRANTELDDIVAKYLNGDSDILKYPSSVDSRNSSALRIYNKTKEQILNLDLNISNSLFYSILSNHLNGEDFVNILNLKDKVYKDGNTYKKVVIEELESSKSLNEFVTQSTYPNIFQAITSALTNAGCLYDRLSSAGGEMNIPVKLFYSSFTLKLETIDAPFTNASASIKNTARRLNDAPYKMFCLPYADNVVLRLNEEQINLDYNKCLQLASSLATGLKTGSEGFLYDIQLLPYCPIENDFSSYQIAQEQNLAYLGSGVVDTDYTLIKNGEQTIGAIFWCSKSSFSTISREDIWYNPNWERIDLADAIGFKANNETILTRMVSPNFANNDTFNQFMNYGVSYIDIDCTYKPYTPYIKCSINYKGLYGKDFNDNRGLILGGDFTLPVVSDKWIDYQIQNKNYSNIFDRETQHLEYAHKWGMASAVTGALGGAAVGGLVGNKLGGRGGAIAGSVGAGITGVLDIIGAAATHGENMDYRKDMFEFNLQNIRALPNGLIKSSAFNYNSRIFPFIEFYDCTPVEKEMVKDKIKYSGMTLDVIGSIQDYMNPLDTTYIQGRIIKIDIDEDSHIASQINNELNMGVYYE